VLNAAGIEGSDGQDGLLRALKRKNLHHEIFAVW
jgi:hypothetical protein